MSIHTQLESWVVSFNFEILRCAQDDIPLLIEFCHSDDLGRKNLVNEAITLKGDPNPYRKF